MEVYLPAAVYHQGPKTVSSKLKREGEGQHLRGRKQCRGKEHGCKLFLQVQPDGSERQKLTLELVALEVCIGSTNS